MAQTAGELLREARLRHNMSQRDLSVFARTSQTAISRWETGERSPTIEQLQRLLGALGEELVLSTESVQDRDELL